MNKASLIDALAQQTSVNKKTIEMVLEALETTIIKSLQAGDVVSLTGFGKFLARTRHSRLGVDPQDPTKRIQMPTVVVPKFKAGKTLKDALKHKP